MGRLPDADAGEPPLDALGDLTVLLVADPLRALHAIAAAWRRRFDPLVIGITGSIAKTSTKEAVAGVLERRLVTLRTEGNQNNEVGLPLTVLRLGPEHAAAVLEMGMYVGGEIRELAAIGLPEIGIVTAVQPVHLSRIGSLDAIEDAKAELVEALPPAADGGLAILNADDERVRRMAKRTSARTMTYGFADDADVRADEVESRGLDGMAFRLRTPAGDRAVEIGALGRLAVHNALAGAAAGLAAGLSLDDVVPGLAAPSRAAHRSTVIRAGGVVIVDDSYNAAPALGASPRSSSWPGSRPPAGSRSWARCASSATRTTRATSRSDGPPARPWTRWSSWMARRVAPPGASSMARSPRVLPAGSITAVADADDAVRAATPIVRPGDAVLVKASRGVELERVVDGLVAALGGPEPAP